MAYSSVNRSWRIAIRLGCAVSLGLLLQQLPGQLTAAQPGSPAQSPLVVGSIDTRGAPSFQLLSEEVARNEIQVFNGVTPDVGDWDSLVVARFSAPSLSTAADSCTAVLVGDAAVLTAAHCVVAVVGDTKIVKPLVLKIGSSWSLVFRCSVDTAYVSAVPLGLRKPLHAADYALCALDASSANTPQLFEDLRREWLAVEPVPQGSPILIAGFGCRIVRYNSAIRDFEWGPQSSVLGVGDVTVAAAADGGDAFTSISDGVTEPAICVGDSGGPAFSGASVSNLEGERTVRGIASYLREKEGKLVSRYSSLASDRFKRFASCWSRANPAARLNVRSALPGAVC